MEAGGRPPSSGEGIPWSRTTPSLWKDFLVARPRRPHLILAAGFLGIAVLVSGCSPDQWGTAARVGETRISIEELQQASSEVARLTREPAAASLGLSERQFKVLTALIDLEIVNRLASSENVSVSDAEVDQRLGDTGRPLEDLEQEAVRRSLPPSRLRDLVRYELQIERLQEGLAARNEDPRSLLRRVQEMGIQVNPRYGEYLVSDQGLDFKPLTGGGLSTAIPQPASSPVASAGAVDQGGGQLRPELEPAP